jgi:hypothetical protein
MINTSKNLPLISIIIRSCNRPKLLEKALQSIVEQSYQSFEVVIVNEGLNSLHPLIDQFKLSLPNIVLIEEYTELPRGRSAAAQLGLNSSHGEYLSFLDDDDWLLPMHFQILLDSIENSPALAVYSSIDCVREGDESTVTYTYRSPYDPNKLYIKNYIPIHAVLFDRVLLDKGVAFSPEFKIYEDWDFWLQISQYTAFKHIDVVTAVYRISPAGSGAHSNHRLQQSNRDAIWEKWKEQQPESFQSDIFSLLIQQEAKLDEKVSAIEAQEQHMQGHRQHVENQQSNIDQLNEKLRQQQNTFQDKLGILEELQQQLNTLSILDEKFVFETKQLSSNQLRINKKINCGIFGLMSIGCLAIIQISLLLLN